MLEVFPKELADVIIIWNEKITIKDTATEEQKKIFESFIEERNKRMKHVLR